MSFGPLGAELQNPSYWSSHTLLSPFIEHGSVLEEKTTSDGIPKPKQNLWSIFPFFRGEEINPVKENFVKESLDENLNDVVDESWSIFPFFSNQIS